MRRDGLDYGLLMQRALRGVMADALSVVSESGLPGDHHFYITFDCRHHDVEMPDWLRAEYPDQITVVLQHEFSDLVVDPAGFSVRMTFSERPASIYAPFDAVLTFVDPSVEFGLKFDATAPDDDPPDAEDDADDEREDAGSAEVVSLDKFRKS